MRYLHTDLVARLEDLAERGLRRFQPPLRPPGAFANFTSNDYLGLARLTPPAVSASGSGASRLVADDCPEVRDLETAVSCWLGYEAALVFSSGYAANVGTIAAIAGRGDLVISDAFNHASLIDGARLSRARVVVTPHCDIQAIEVALRSRTEPRAWVIAESYYSMDADGPDLAALRKVCDAHDAGLYIDEAHALGVLGPEGRGRCAEAGVQADVLVGTLGKAFGSQGAFVCGDEVLRDWLWNKARSFVFSTGIAPASAAAALRALRLMSGTPTLRDRVAAMTHRLRSALAQAGGATITAGRQPAGQLAVTAAPQLLGFGHIVPIVVHTPERATRIARELALAGVLVQPIRPPTVPEGTSRLRLTVSAAHTEEEIDAAVATFNRYLSGTH